MITPGWRDLRTPLQVRKAPPWNAQNPLIYKIAKQLCGTREGAN